MATSDCATCREIPDALSLRSATGSERLPAAVDALLVIGGSPDPLSEPFGQLRRCPGCDACFLYSDDHDAGTRRAIERVSPGKALQIAERALPRIETFLALHAVPRSSGASDREWHATEVLHRRQLREEIARLRQVIASGK